MNRRTQTGMWMIAAAALSVVTVLAFSAGNTGARTLTASVVNDADAFLAIEANSASPHKDFVSVVDGRTVLTFDAANPNAAGTGMNPGSTYMFDAILKVTNKGTATVNIDVLIGGDDASLCEVALTTAGTQGDADYSANPAPLASAVGSVAYLGIKLSAAGLAAGDAVDCTLTVTAAR